MISNVSTAAIAFAVSISLLIGRGRWRHKGASTLRLAFRYPGLREGG